MQRTKPTCLEMEAYINAGYSLRKVKEITGYSVTTLSKICEDCGIEKPPIGRPKGYKMEEKSKAKIGEANRKG